MNKLFSILFSLVLVSSTIAEEQSSDELLSEESVAELPEATTVPLTPEEIKANQAKNNVSTIKPEASKVSNKKTITKSKKKRRAYSYTVKGKRYHVIKSADNFKQIGWASWYGPGFHGKKTANGEIFNQNALTAAHKTLPLGTYVYVQNLKNGKIVKVKINDRGPFAKGRVIDLSKAAAKKLNLVASGHGKVVISVAKR